MLALTRAFPQAFQLAERPSVILAKGRFSLIAPVFRSAYRLAVFEMNLLYRVSTYTI